MQDPVRVFRIIGWLLIACNFSTPSTACEPFPISVLFPDGKVQEDQNEDRTDPEIQHWLDRMATVSDKNFEALNKLIQLGKKVEEPVRGVLNNREETPIRRWQAAMVLGRVGGERSIADLMTVLEEQEPQVKTLQGVVVESLLGRSNEKILDQLNSLFDNPDVPVQVKEILLEKLSDAKINSLPSDQWEGIYEWVDSFADAGKIAADENKLVMTIVYATQSIEPVAEAIDGSAIPFHVLLRGPMTDPDVRAVIGNHFIVRKHLLHIHAFSTDYDIETPDELAEAGINAHNIKPPAILFHTADGQLIQHIDGIGTFNSRLLHVALATVASHSSDRPVDPGTLVEIPPGVPGNLNQEWVESKLKFLTGNAESALSQIKDATSSCDDADVVAILDSLSGKVLHHEGRVDEASRQLKAAIDGGVSGNLLGESIYWLLDCSRTGEVDNDVQKLADDFVGRNPESLWSQKIRMQSDDAEFFLSTAESFDFSGANMLQKKIDNAPALEPTVHRALEFLIRSQSRNGEWRPLEKVSQHFTQPAVTAICANAIRQWRHSNIEFEDAFLAELERSELSAREYLETYAAQGADHGPMSYSQVWNQTYVLEYFLDVLEHSTDDLAAKNAGQKLVDDLASKQYDEGGWSYLPPDNAERWGGIRPHSFNTAPILIELARAKRLGLNVKESVIGNAAESLDSVRERNGAFAYAPASGFAWMTRRRCSIARDALCELALNASGKENSIDIKRAFERFHKNRSDLEIPRKLYASFFNSNGHGAYFYAFGYFYAAKSIPFLPPDRQPDAAGDLQTDLLSIVELDGTWIDMHAQGKTYATGMILRALYEINRIEK